MLHSYFAVAICRDIGLYTQDAQKVKSLQSRINIKSKQPTATKENRWHDLQNILRQSYDYLMIMTKLRWTYDGRLLYKTSYEEREAFLGMIHSQNCKIV